MILKIPFNELVESDIARELPNLYLRTKGINPSKPYTVFEDKIHSIYVIEQKDDNGIDATSERSAQPSE